MPRSSIPKGNDVLDLLIDDHRSIQQMFTDFTDLDDDDQKRELVSKTCIALTIHATIEEEIFYPAMREFLDEDDLLDDALVEHDIAKEMIAEIEDMSHYEALYDARFRVLGEYVNHHFLEEEEELFPRIREAKFDLVDIGRRLRERRDDLNAQYEPYEEEDEEDEEAENEF